MGTFEELANIFLEGGMKAASVAKDVAATAKIISDIKAEELKMSGVYKEIGKLFCEKAGDTVDSEFIPLLQKIADSKEKIERLNEEKENLKAKAEETEEEAEACQEAADEECQEADRAAEAECEDAEAAGETVCEETVAEELDKALDALAEAVDQAVTETKTVAEAVVEATAQAADEMAEEMKESIFAEE